MGNFMAKYTPESKAGETGTMTFRDAFKAKSFAVIDVRSPEEYSDGHFENAINIPISDFEKRLPELGTDKTRPMGIYCRSGARSGSCVSIAKDKGFVNVFHFDNAADLTNLVSKLTAH